MESVFLPIAAFCLAVVVTVPVGAADIIDLEVWTERDTIVHASGTAEQRILELAQLYLSAQVYGYRYRYVPAWRSREIEELFELEPVAEVPWGDPQLSVYQLRDRGDQLWGLFHYALDAHQRSIRNVFASSRVRDAEGRGTGAFTEGMDGVRDALVDALRAAVLSHLRATEKRRPRAVEGRLVLAEPPRTLVDAGRYVTTVHIRIIVDRVEYSVATSGGF